MVLLDYKCVKVAFVQRLLPGVEYKVSIFFICWNFGKILYVSLTINFPYCQSF